MLPLTSAGSSTSDPSSWDDLNLLRGRSRSPTFATRIRATSRPCGIPLRRGRSSNTADVPKTPPVVLINETMARQFWPNEDPIGRRLKIDMWKPDDVVEIIGVVGDLHPQHAR